MAPQQFMNHHFPPPLQLAVWCSYINGFFSLISPGRGFVGLLGLVAIAGAVGAWVMVNGKRWGYLVCLGAGVASFGVSLLGFFAFGLGAGLNLLFSLALLAGLVHPLSRQCVKIWLD
jgi:hypothetical protein